MSGGINPKDLGINVDDTVKTKELFGQFSKKMAGIAGTLHITCEKDKTVIVDTAWVLSKSSGKPVVIVVRA